MLMSFAASSASIDVTGQVYARGDNYTCQVYVAPGQYPNNNLSTDSPPGDFHAVPAGGGVGPGEHGDHLVAR